MIKHNISIKLPDSVQISTAINAVTIAPNKDVALNVPTEIYLPASITPGTIFQ
jgi:hypothetical protein